MLGLMMPARPRKDLQKSKKNSPGELALIERIRGRVDKRRNAEVRLGIGDDAAILRPRPGEEIVVTTDLCLEGRHFHRGWHSPASVGHRTLARGLSDLAAMGARPVAAFLSLALPRRAAADEGWLDGFLDGLLTLAARARVTLAGGDTSEAPGEAILADIVLLGAVPTGRALRRDRARPGDRLFCTGALGGAAAELRLLANGDRATRPADETRTPPLDSLTIAGWGNLSRAPYPQTPENSHPQLFPEPRLKTGLALLRRRWATAAMDLSDGLSTDLGHLCEASDVHAELSLAQIPLHPLAAALGPTAALDLALHGGEDYELLFTAAPKTRLPPRVGGVPVTEIGRLTKSKAGALNAANRITAIAADGTRSELEAGGWEHLR